MDGEKNSWLAQRVGLIEQELKPKGIYDPAVLTALAKVSREKYVPEELRSQAYENSPLAIGCDQTISQPLIVALMTQLAKVSPGDRVLEIGTGSGYQTAILAEMGAEIFTIERIEELSHRAEETLRRNGYSKVNFRRADGANGWPEAAPFAVIILTAAPLAVPQALFDQLAEGGRLVAPVGPIDAQYLEIWTRQGDSFSHRRICPVRFVPMLSGV